MRGGGGTPPHPPFLWRAKDTAPSLLWDGPSQMSLRGSSRQPYKGALERPPGWSTPRKALPAVAWSELA